jgi:hypothetical protein
MVKMEALGHHFIPSFSAHLIVRGETVSPIGVSASGMASILCVALS